MPALWYGRSGDLFPSYFPTSTIKVGGVYVGWDQIIVALVALTTTMLLYVFFKRSRSGAAMRAVVDNADLLDLGGISPVTVRRWSCVIGCSFAVLSGALIAPSLNLDAFVLTLLVVQSFGAAAIGYFSNLPLTYAGGLLIGVVAALATKYSIDYTWLTGLPASVPFIALFLVLVLMPRALLVDRRNLRPRPRRVRRAAAPFQITTGAVLLIVLVLVPQFAGTRLITYTDALTYVVLFLSLGLLVKTSGQVSLCHVTFAAIGASGFSHVTHGSSVPWLVGVLLAGLVCVPVGAIVSIPAIRLSGTYLALATLGFGIFVERMLFTTSWMFGTGINNSLVMRRPSLSWLDVKGDEGYYYVVLAFVVVIAAIVIALHHSRLGRLLRGLGDSPTALSTQGASINTTRVLVFCISAFIAGISGAARWLDLSRGERHDVFVVHVLDAVHSSGHRRRRRAVVRVRRSIRVGARALVRQRRRHFAVSPDPVWMLRHLRSGVGDVGTRARAKSHGTHRSPSEASHPRRNDSRAGGDPRPRDRGARSSGDGRTWFPVQFRLRSAKRWAYGTRDRRHLGPLRRRGCRRSTRPQGSDRPHHRLDRPERRGQDDNVQCVLWLAPTNFWSGGASRRGHHAAEPRRRVRSLAWGEHFRGSSCSTL